jgi:hypothetical protein
MIFGPGVDAVITLTLTAFFLVVLCTRAEKDMKRVPKVAFWVSCTVISTAGLIGFILFLIKHVSLS